MLDLQNGNGQIWVNNLEHGTIKNELKIVCDGRKSMIDYTSSRWNVEKRTYIPDDNSTHPEPDLKNKGIERLLCETRDKTYLPHESLTFKIEI